MNEAGFIRANGEFYVCPLYNQLLKEGARVSIHEIERAQMHGLGTPENLAVFLATKQETVIVELEEPIEDTHTDSSSESQMYLHNSRHR